MNESILTQIRDLAEEVCVRENCRLYDLEFVGQGRQRILRVFIDKTDSAGSEDAAGTTASEEVEVVDVETVDVESAETTVVETQGVSLNDCSNVSNALSLRLDVEDIVPGDQYSLEVSSPGLDRKLLLPWHFEAVKGKKVRVWLDRNLADFGETKDGSEAPSKWSRCKRVESLLKEVSDKGVTLIAEDTEVEIPFTEINRAKLVVELSTPQKPERQGKEKKSKTKKPKTKKQTKKR